MPESEPAPKRNVLFYLAAEGVIPVLGGCAGAIAGGPVGGVAGVAVGTAIEKAINLFGKGIVARWQAWFARHRQEADAAVAELAALPPAEAREVARSIFLELAPDADAQDVSLAIEFLTALPRSVSRALVPNPAGGRSLPPTVGLDDPRALLQLLPADIPPYPSAAELPGTPYRLVELIGSGGFGAVYRATSPTLQHLPLAIKFCLDRLLLPTLNQERSNLERLMRAGGRGSNHVVRLYGYDLDHPTPYLVYEYVPGGDLTQLLAARSAALGHTPPADEVLGWIAQIADGLAFAHRAGLVHRDLKPANVLADGDTLKLADFGLGGVAVARAAVRSRIGVSTVDYLSLADQASLFRGAGTPLYMSPEQRRGATPDPRHDLYALGVVWFQLLVGDVSRELHPGWAKELVVRCGVPPSHIVLIERCVGWYDERPRDASELLEPLRELHGQSSLPLAAEIVPSPPGISSPAADTAVDRSVATPRPTPPMTEGQRRGLVAALARLDTTYAELRDMAKWRFEVTAAYGLFPAVLIGGLLGFIAAVATKDEGFSVVLGMIAGLLAWGIYIFLIRSGVKAVAEDVQKRADELVEELVTDYTAEMATWGGRAALRHPATVRQIREELDPRSKKPPVLPPAASPATGLAWVEPAKELLADPLQKSVFLSHLRALDTTLRKTAKTINDCKVMRIIFPSVFGGGGALAIALPTALTGALPWWVGVPLGLAVGGVVAKIFLHAFGAAIRDQEAKQTKAVQVFAASYPLIAEQCGGEATLCNPQFVHSIRTAVDDSPKPGFWTRLFNLEG